MLKIAERGFSIVLSAVLCLVFLFVDCKALKTSARAMVLINADTLEILDFKNHNEKLPVASTTKLMTALIIAENCNLEKEIVTTAEMVTVEGSSMGLLEGDRVSYYSLLVGMMLPSGNDAANTAAISYAGSVSRFAEIMNEKAKEIGMENSHFVTPSGLHDDEHYSTAFDMALLASEVLKNETLREIVACEKKTVSFGNPPYKRTLYNHNKLLSKHEFAIGLKTGYTKKAGRCLVSAAKKDGCSVIAVTLDAPDDWNDHEKLLNYGLSVLTPKSINADVSGISIPIVGAINKTLSVEAPEIVIGHTQNSVDITYKIYHQPFLYAPVLKEQTVGFIEYYCDGRLLKTLPLKAKENIEAKEIKPKSEISKWLFNVYLLIVNCL